MSTSTLLAPAEIRRALLRNGYSPLPVNGKAPTLSGWQQKFETNDGEIDLWSNTWPTAINTGALTKFTPAVDIDIMIPDAADAIEELARETFGEHGDILTRFGRAPKRAILLRTDEPFKKIVQNFVAPDGSEQKIEILGDGQQIVVDGIHPDINKPYGWHGGSPCTTPREQLPYVREAELRAFVAEASRMLVEDFGFTAKVGSKQKKGNGADGVDAGADWGTLTENIRQGHALHDSFRDLAVKLIASGMSAGAAVNFLRGLMDGSAAPRDQRFHGRCKKIPGLVESAQEFLIEEENKKRPAVEPRALTAVIEVFDKWLALNDKTPVYAMLGTVAANLLAGDPVWLGLIAPPSSAKTELLKSLSRLPCVAVAEALTPASLLSGTSKKQRDKRATGGLLMQMGKFGILAFKDFGTVLDMRVEARGEMLSALRRIFDGEYVRQIGADGGRTLSWKGKAGLVFAATQKYDLYHAVIGTLGDRFLLVRLDPSSEEQFGMCFKHIGAETQTMRDQLAEAVAGLFASFADPLPEPGWLAETEMARLKRVVMLATRLRAGVERDRIKRDIEAVYDPEGPARLALSLERLLAGLIVIGLDRDKAMDIVETVAMDSTPRFRLSAYNALTCEWQSTRAIANVLKLPTTTVQRALEDLVAQGLAVREEKEAGANRWCRPRSEGADFFTRKLH